MAILLQFVLADGRIAGYWEGMSDTLGAQEVTDDPTYGYAVYEGEAPALTLADNFFMQSGVVTPKTVLTLTATPSAFAGDGVTTCTVSVSPFVACSVAVDGVPFALTIADPTLVLTSDVPHVFQLSLVPMAAYRADPRTVEAT